MKKHNITITAIFLALMIMSLYNGCRKGEDDPLISLKSRDAKITAKWKLTKIEGTEISTDFYGTMTNTYSYDGTTYNCRRVYSSSGQTVDHGGSGTYEMTIDKHGKLSFNETFTDSAPGSIQEVNSGDVRWIWFDADKDKTLIYLEDGGYNIFGGGDIYTINRLTSKELVLKIKYNYSNASGGVNYEDSKDLTYTFAKQK